MKSRSFLTIALFALLFSACNLNYFKDAEFGEFVWDGSIAIPLGELNYTVVELFAELDDGSATIEPGEDNVVMLIYEEVLEAQSATDFLELLDQTFNGALPNNTNINNSPNQQTIQANQIFEFDLATQGDEAFDSIYFNAGNLAILLNSTIPYPVDYTLTFQSLAQGQSSIINSGVISAAGDLQDALPLADVTGLLHLDAAGNPSSNKFLLTVTYDFDVPVGGSVSANQGLNFDLQISNAEYSSLFGNVGSQALDVNLEEVDLGFFDIFSGGDLRFANPKIDFTFQSSFGFPLGVDYSGISAIASDGTRLALTGSITQERQIVQAPTIDEQGSTLETIHTIDAASSNIDELFSVQPRSFSLGLSSVSNPINGPSQYNFLDELNSLQATALIQIPLDMAIDELIANQNFDFRNGEALEQAKRAFMKVSSTNEMPMGGDLEIQFLNASGDVIYTIDERPVFGAAEVGPDGRTIGFAEGSTEVLLEDEALRQMESAARINIVARLSSTDADQGLAVKFYDDYILNIKVALQADVELTATNE